MRYQLIDSVQDRTDDRIVVTKHVTLAEEYLADHFPTFPVLPGVMMLEVMAQAARRLLDEARGPWVVAEVRNIRYGNMVRPGQRLVVEVERIKAEGNRHSFAASGSVDGAMALQGRLVMRPANSSN